MAARASRSDLQAARTGFLNHLAAWQGSASNGDILPYSHSAHPGSCSSTDRVRPASSEEYIMPKISSILACSCWAQRSPSAPKHCLPLPRLDWSRPTSYPCAAFGDWAFTAVLMGLAYAKA